jgi:hypothetical protein
MESTWYPGDKADGTGSGETGCFEWEGHRSWGSLEDLGRGRLDVENVQQHGHASVSAGHQWLQKWGQLGTTVLCLNI